MNGFVHTYPGDPTEGAVLAIFENQSKRISPLGDKGAAFVAGQIWLADLLGLKDLPAAHEHGGSFIRRFFFVFRIVTSMKRR